MQKFKPAKDLNLTAREKIALVGVMKRLARGDLKHHKDFNMDKWDCGNVHCIGGWADALYKTDFNTKPYDPAVDELFFAHNATVARDDITPKEAAKAIKNFLLGGKPNWKAATQRR